jgi:hypothetical protein
MNVCRCMANGCRMRQWCGRVSVNRGCMPGRHTANMRWRSASWWRILVVTESCRVSSRGWADARGRRPNTRGRASPGCRCNRRLRESGAVSWKDLGTGWGSLESLDHLQRRCVVIQRKRVAYGHLQELLPLLPRTRLPPLARSVLRQVGPVANPRERPLLLQVFGDS